MATSTPATLGLFGSKFKTDLPLIPTTNSKLKLTSLDIGGDVTDSAFRAAAAAMIDNILLVRSRGNQELAKRLLEFHAKYFEQAQIQLRLMTYTEVLARLLESTVVRAKFVNELAYALRQETVNEMVSNPEIYRLALMNGKEAYVPEKLRQQSTGLHQSAMAALSEVTQVPVEIHEVEFKKEGQRLTTYSKEMEQPSASPIALLQRDNSYSPLLNRPEYFAIMQRQRVEPVNPKVEFFPNDPSPAEILISIADEDLRFYHEYEIQVKRLDTMLKAGELSKNDLIQAYTKSLNSEHQGQARYVGIEHGSQELFEEIILSCTSQGSEQAVVLSHGERVINDLVCALARGIVMGQLDSSLIFEAEERPSLAVR